MTVWQSIKSFVSSLWQSKAAASTTSTVAIDATPGSAYAAAFGEGLKVVSQLQSELNTQPMIDAKVRQEKQSRIDAINRAIENGDLDSLRKLSSL